MQRFFRQFFGTCLGVLLGLIVGLVSGLLLMQVLSPHGKAWGGNPSAFIPWAIEGARGGALVGGILGFRKASAVPDVNTELDDDLDVDDEDPRVPREEVIL